MGFNEKLLIVIIAVIVICITFIYVCQRINANKTKISKADGIQESTYISIGGIEQYVHIRGEDIKNPIILFIHGGPGSPLNFLSYYYQPYLESDYTFVCMEQRGSGRTYYSNKEQTDLSVDILLSDTDELVDYLSNRFGQEKVIIMGQSWGSVLGSRYVLEHPEKVSAYIGVGQVVEFMNGGVQSAKSALELAREKDNIKDVKILEESLKEVISAKSLEDLDAVLFANMISVSQKYLKSNKEISELQQLWQGLSSPSFSRDDLRWFLNISDMNKYVSLEYPLLQYLYYEFNIYDLGSSYEVPIFYIQGENDSRTPTQMVLDYYDTIQAPAKAIKIISNAGHTPFLDDRQSFSNAVKSVCKITII